MSSFIVKNVYIYFLHRSQGCQNRRRGEMYFDGLQKPHKAVKTKALINIAGIFIFTLFFSKFVLFSDLTQTSQPALPASIFQFSCYNSHLVDNHELYKSIASSPGSSVVFFEANPEGKTISSPTVIETVTLQRYHFAHYKRDFTKLFSLCAHSVGCLQTCAVREMRFYT